MNIKIIFYLIIFISFLLSCSSVKKATKINEYAIVETSQGQIIIGLYDATPKHKNNFIYNINNSVYDSVLIYSVVPNGIFKIGLPQNISETDFLIKNFEKSRLQSETNPYLINKTGAVGMLRLPNEKNSEKFSDTQLFYICQGMSTDEKLLHTLVANRNAPVIGDYITRLLKEDEYKHFADSLDYYLINNMNKQRNDLYLRLTDLVLPKIKADGRTLFSLNKFQMKTYTSIGGVPVYDGEYVVFGEVVQGIEIVNSISKIKTGLYNKPKTDLFILNTKHVSKKEFKKYYEHK